MAQSNFAYLTPSNDAAGLPLALSIFADRAHLRGQIGDDAQMAGVRLAQSGEMALLLTGGEASPLGDVVMVDCPGNDAATLAALTRLDMRVAQAGAALVVSTSLAALDDIFGCLDQSGAQILVDPSRAERVLALGRALAEHSGARVRELSDEDRLALLQLTEQVSQIAQKLERLGLDQFGSPAVPDRAAPDSAFRFESPRAAYAAAEKDDPSARLVRAARPALPDPRLVRRIIRQRQLRARFFDGDLFGDPAWDMLLDLTAARAEHARVSVTSLCIASGVPPTTALRWIGQMSETGLLERVEDETDRRRAFITLTDKAADSMARYFAEIGAQAARLV